MPVKRLSDLNKTALPQPKTDKTLPACYHLRSLVSNIAIRFSGGQQSFFKPVALRLLWKGEGSL
jgi:hypothetical protein